MIKTLKTSILIAVATILVLPVVVIGLLQTDWAKGLICNAISEYSPRYINGRIDVGTISGSMLGDIGLHDIVLVSEDDTVVNVGLIKIDFDVLPLFRGKFNVHLLTIDNVVLNVVTDSVNGLNLSRIALPSSDEPVSAHNSFINIDVIEVDNLDVNLSGFAAPIPTVIRDIRFRGGFALQGLSTALRVDTLAAVPDGGWPRLCGLSMLLEADDKEIKLSDFHIQTKANRLVGSGVYASNSDFDGSLVFSNPDVDEFSFVLPQISVAYVDSVSFSVDNKDDRIGFKFSAFNDNESVVVGGVVDNFSKIFSGDDTNTPFSVDIDFHSVSVPRWVTSISNHIVVDGQIGLKGSKIQFSDDPISVVANLNGSSFDKIKANVLKVNGYVTGDEIKGSLLLKLNNQQAEAQYQISDWRNKFRYSWQLYLSGIDASKFPGKFDIKVAAASFAVNGVGYSPQNMRVSIKGKLNGVSGYGFIADSLLVDFSNVNELVTASRIDGYLQGFYLGAKGLYNINSGFVDGSLVSNGSFSGIIADSLRIAVDRSSVLAHLKGTVEELRWSAKADFGGMVVDSVGVGSLSVVADGEMNNGKPTVNAGLTLGNVDAGSIRLLSASLDGSYAGAKVLAKLSAVTSDSLILDTEIEAALGDTVGIVIPNLKLSVLGYDIRNENPLALRYGSQSLWFDSFNLSFLSGSQHHLLSAGGVVNPFGVSDFALTTGTVPLGLIQQFLPGINLGGVVSASIKLSGTPNNHHVSVVANADSVSYNGINIHAIRQKGEFTNRVMNIEVQVLNPAGEALTVKGSSGYLLTQDSLEFRLVKKPDIVLQSMANRLPIAYLIPPGSGVDVSKGLLSYDLKFSGDLTNPYASGFVYIDDGVVKIPAAGVNLDRVGLKMRFDGSTVLVDTLVMNSGKGKMALGGSLGFAGGLLSPLSNMVMSVDGENFRLRRRNFFDITVDASAVIKAVDAVPVFDGAVNVKAALLNVDRLMAEGDGPKRYRDDVLLVSSLKNLRGTDDKGVDVVAVSNNYSVPMLNFAKAKGKLKVVIPYNTWLKGDDMGIELRGDIDVLANGSELELFGSLGVNRGFYNLYGRKFQISKGELTFTGGTELNPALNIDAQYRFRSSNRESRVLTAIIGGKLNQPEIKFMLDDNEISQGDAVGYIVFGKPMAELGGGVTQLGNNQSANAVTGVLASQLSRILGNSLSLDVIEIDASDNWENSSFVVGKYITNNLFVIYQRGFGKATDNDIATQKVILEYELNRHLFFRLESGEGGSSGVDLIIKNESKR